VCNIWIITIVCSALWHKVPYACLCVFSPDWPLTVRPGRIACYILCRHYRNITIFFLFSWLIISVFFYCFPAQDLNVSAVSTVQNYFRRSCCSLKYNMMKFGSKNSANTPIKCTIRLLDDNQLLDSEFQV